MPTYQYQCFDCQHTFEEFQKISDDPISVCPVCQSNNVKRLLFAAAFHLKGTGWYKTDYGSSSSGSNGSSSSNGTSKKSEKNTDSGEKKDSSSSSSSESSSSSSAKDSSKETSSAQAS